MVLRGIPLFIIIFYQLFINSAQKLVLRTFPPSPVYAAVNTNLVLSCSVDDNNFVTLRWASDTNEVNSTTSNRSLTSVVFHQLKYSDKGIYYCQAFNRTSDLMVAQTNVSVKVGDPPPEPPTPTMKRVCGYPPTEVIISYQYHSSLLTPTYYPVTVDLIVCPMSMSNPCLKLCDNFKLVGKSRKIIHRPKNYSFEVNVADVVSEMVPHFPFCVEDSYIDCSLLCSCVRTTNAFGARHSATRLKRIEKYSGEVVNLRAIKIGRNSITLAWGLPLCLRNSTQTYTKLFYWIWCEHSLCGNKIMIKSNVNVISGLNYTIHSLKEYTNYTIHASSSFFRDFAEAGEHVSISVQTKEGVPRMSPVIETLRWQSECNGSALISWKVNNKAALLGEVRQYIITYQVANDTSSRNISNVSADVHQLVISGLRRDKSYEFTIRVCTGGGCSKASTKHGLSSNDCTSSDPPPDRFHGPKWIWMLIGVALLSLLLVVIILCFVAFKMRRNGRVDLRPELPTEGIYPSEFPSYQPEAHSDYARADGQFSRHSDPITLTNGPQELQISSTCLSRSSSVLTCSTEM